MKTIRPLIHAVTGLLASAASVACASSAIAAPEKAQQASSLTSTVAVATHLSYTNTPYWSHFCTPGNGVIDSLLELGVKRIRDGVTDSRLAKIPSYVSNYNSCTSPSEVIDYGYYRQILKDRFLALSSKGIKLIAVAGGGAVTNNSAQNDIQTRIIPDLLSVQGAIIGIETNNEPNIAEFQFNYNGDGFVNSNGTITEQGQGWNQGNRNYLRDLSQAIRNNSTLRGRTIIGPAIAYGWGPEYKSAIDRDRGGNLESVLVPFQSQDKRLLGNLHNYNAFGYPPSIGFTNWDGSNDWWYCLSRGMGTTSSCSSLGLGGTTSSTGTFEGTYPTIPLAATETGYANRDRTNPTADPNPSSVTEWVTARYLPRQILEHYRRGMRLTTLYELMDVYDPGQAHGGFGLIRRDLSRRPSFYTVKGLLNLLKDSSTSFTPGSLDYAVTVPSGNTTVRRLLFQKSNGEFYLVLWNEAFNWAVNWSTQPASTSEVRTSPIRVSLQVNSAVSSITQYRYDEANNYTLVSTPISLQNGQVQIDVPDIPIFIKLSGAVAQGTKTPPKIAQGISKIQQSTLMSEVVQQATFP
jgi:hypothetical protein